jgi:cobalt-zinc-cadmium efflux system membrane fusion protein
MNRNTIVAVALIGVVALGAGAVVLTRDPAPAAEAEHGGEEHDHGEEAPSTHIAMTAAQAKSAGATLAVAGPGTVAQTLLSSGTIVFDSAGMARARARFPGVVRDVKRNVGDRVSAGEVLATVESNESLQAYQVRAPIEGTVIERNTSVGEIADTSPLFVIANPARVWAEVHIFSKDLGSVSAGKKVKLRTSDSAVTGEGTISAILPVTETATQTVIARISLDDVDGRWRPGMLVTADVVMSEREVPVAIPASAIQTLNEKTTIFVQDGDKFEIRQILPGAQNNDKVEVLEGLDAGETYVATNSFLMKADAGKASAEHKH